MKAFQLQQGFSLLEILIALIILAIGLLGFAQAEIIALRENQNAYVQNIAMLQATTLAEHIHMCKGNQSCLIQATVDWQAENKLFLPFSENKIITNSLATQIIMNWSEIKQHKQQANKKKITLQIMP